MGRRARSHRARQADRGAGGAGSAPLDAIRRSGLCASGERVLVAASAGLDSTVLAHALLEGRAELGIEVCLAHVHHGLRGDEADRDQARVEALARAHGLEVAVRRVDPRSARAGCNSRDRPTLQEAARTLRRAALREIADELRCDRIATAHHADDQAETLLMRMLRGTGPDGMAGIPARSADGRFIRPLLSLPREALERYARARGIQWCEDSSNGSDRYQRNRIRTHWIPALAQEFNPKLLRALNDLAEAQRRDADWIEELVAREASARFSTRGAWLRIDTTDWERLPEALSRRLVRSALVRSGAARHVTRRHLERMLAFFSAGRPGTAIELPGGLCLARDRAGFRLGPSDGALDSRPQGKC